MQLQVEIGMNVIPTIVLDVVILCVKGHIGNLTEQLAKAVALYNVVTDSVDCRLYIIKRDAALMGLAYLVQVGELIKLTASIRLLVLTILCQIESVSATTFL